VKIFGQTPDHATSIVGALGQIVERLRGLFENAGHDLAGGSSCSVRRQSAAASLRAAMMLNAVTPAQTSRRMKPLFLTAV
jgi:hypothetical protein